MIFTAPFTTSRPPSLRQCKAWACIWPKRYRRGTVVAVSLTFNGDIRDMLWFRSLGVYIDAGKYAEQ
jgi:hypothetical protein